MPPVFTRAPTPPGALIARPLVDRFGRRITYVRLSLTERCNFRCVYCMPAEGDPFSSRPELLDWDEITRMMRRLAERGVRRVRLTGGEPLVRAGVPDLVARLKALPGLEHVALTTNAFLLGRQATALADAGLDSANVSLDSLRPERFRAITRTGELSRVLDGVRALEDAGVTDIKFNAVLVRGVNDDEVEDLIAFAIERGHPLRFIEVMPIGTDTVWGEAGTTTCVPAAEIRQRVRARWRVTADAERHGAGPARYLRVHDVNTPPDGHPIGIISAVTECFCANCNRLRITATGGLRGCLADDHELSLRDILRAPLSHADQISLLDAALERALGDKRASHDFDIEKGGVTAKSMNAIGG